MENKTLSTASELLINSGLDYNVVETPIYDNEGRDLKEFKAIQHENGNTFQVAKKGYTIIQNRDALGIMDEVVGSGMAKYSKAQSFKGGAVVNVRVELPFEYDVMGDDIKTYMRLTTSHDGSSSFRMDLMEERLVCTNGMKAMVATMSKAFKHTRNYRLKVTDAQVMFEQYRVLFAKQKSVYETMARNQMNSLEVDSFLNELLKIEDVEETNVKILNQKELIEGLFVNGKGNNRGAIARTEWAMYNGVTDYVDHHRGTDSNRGYTSEYSAGAKLKEKAYAILTR